MKKIQKTLAVILAVMMAFSVFAVIPYAADDSVSAKMICYNVAGLPDFGALIGKESSKDVAANQTKIGKQIEARGFDVVAVQEDFGNHSDLAEAMPSYTYQTKSSGSVPGGDGLNVFTRNAKIYNATRVAWDVCYGSIIEGDTLTPKGILYTVLDMGNGIYVDFYVLHADAFDGDGSALARAAQYRQLIDLVEKNSADRPVVITGDFNTSLHIKNAGDDAADEIAMRQIIIEEGGFKDAWIELKNNGNYDDFSSWTGSYWGRWDSVEKFFYKDGGGVTVTPTDFDYVTFYDDKGATLSDHNAATCNFNFEKTDDFVEDQRAHNVVNPSSFSIFLNKVKWILKDLAYIFSHLGELKGVIK